MTDHSVASTHADESCSQVMAQQIAAGLKVGETQDFEVRYVQTAHPEAENLPVELYRTFFPSTVLFGVNGDYINDVHENLVIDLQAGHQFRARIARLLVNEIAFEEATVSYASKIPLNERRWLVSNANCLAQLADAVAPKPKFVEQLQPLGQLFRMLTLHEGSLTDGLDAPGRNAILRRMVNQWWGPSGDVAQRRTESHVSADHQPE